MVKEVKIFGRTVDSGHEPFVVAEVGINHNGDVERALLMVNAAKQSGCDAIKFSIFKAAEFCNPAHTIAYRHKGEVVTEPELEMFRRCELPIEAWRLISAECDRHNIIFFATPQNRSDLDVLLRLGVPCIKIGSDDLTNTALIKDYASEGLPVILSTGMADMGDVRAAINATGLVPIIVCACTSEYPCPPEHANLARITSLKKATAQAIGFSDHTEGSQAATMAVALGACYFEKHFTLDKTLRGPDHAFSANHFQLSHWVSAIRQARVLLGSGEIEPSDVELAHRNLWRRTSGQQIRGVAP